MGQDRRKDTDMRSSLRSFFTSFKESTPLNEESRESLETGFVTGWQSALACVEERIAVLTV